METLPVERLMRKRRAEIAPVTARSLVLLRLGELCNNKCPMCSNSGDPALWRVERAALLERVERVVALGFRRVIVTGGEPTIHPAFWDVVNALAGHGVVWDINSHGRSFARRDFAERAMAAGLERAIISLHSHIEAASAVISGTAGEGHRQTVAGIDHLVAAGAVVMLNLVLCTENLDHVGDWVDDCADRWGDDVTLKVCFPFHGGHGGAWAGIDLRYDDVRAAIAETRARAKARAMRLHWEGVPHCVHGDPAAPDLSRSGFGESHYLDDHDGVQLYSMRAIEAALHVYPERCRGCAALARCPGVEERYLRRHGSAELSPFVGDGEAKAEV
jgi:molybdenum cofactor biosynthesis enzyme MoaA